MTAISRHYHREQIIVDNFETRVAIYEDQIRGWFIDQVRILEKVSDHAAFVVLLVALSYIEGHAIFLKGEDSKNHSRAFFQEAFNAIFPGSSKDERVTLTATEMRDFASNELYDQMRNGLFHTGMIRAKVVLSGNLDAPFGFAMTPDLKKIVRIDLNPHKMLDAIEAHLAYYLMRLHNPEERQLRENFNKAWELRHESEI